MSRRTTGIVVAAVVAVAGAMILGLLVLPATAQDVTESPSTAAPDERGAAQGDEFAERLAEELGLPVDEVAAAIDTVHEELREERRAEHRARLEERLAAAVESGDLTQEEADALLALFDSRTEDGLGFPYYGPGGHHGPGGRGFGGGFGPWGGFDSDDGSDDVPDEQAS
jgi:hypothetical protein